MSQTILAEELTTSAALLARTRAVIAGGGSSNMRNAGMSTPLVVDGARGCRLHDVEGNELIDVNMGYGPHLFGYADRDVLDPVREQLTRAAVTGLPHRLDHQAAELITELVPSVQQVRFANSGTEAITSALRLARFHTGRSLVLTFEGHYHGWSETVLRRSAITAGRPQLHRPRPEPGAPGMIPGALSHTLELPWNDVAALERAFAQDGNQIAAVILEPVCGNAGVVPPRPGFLARLAELTKKHNSLLVYDEVITGFRLAAGGAQELYGVLPDLTIVSKVLGGGFPVAAFGGSTAMMAPLARNEAFHAGVFAGNHAAITAATAMLTKIKNDPGVYGRLEQTCAGFESRLREIFAAAGRPVRIARSGSVLSVALLARPMNTEEAYDGAVSLIAYPVHRKLQLLCQQAGVYFHPNPLEPWFLSTAHGPAELDRITETIAAALHRL
ncbi:MULTISPECIES: aspartate aminotransferase family protein [unclassified Crossiella]|uniref:aspartate aminotransferase family protein n=1 Tax=unclassified Crossiella TaxID=2620835 RepID=UPI001FFF6753|nr:MULTISPECIES: aspartate aminotransferase family protein [unclassified Crossiella]MCK2244833.1 aspartate aminotransferase family protein [Crossiella sp. S99.2]MCK2258475.1 aspartate aminotransferase family protein [Crossiella sp. S99.1]